MKHIKPYLLFEAKAVNPNQAEFILQLKDKFSELGIEWKNVASERSQKLGTVELHLSPKDAWKFITRSGWEAGLSAERRLKFDRGVNDIPGTAEFKLAGQIDRPLWGTFKIYIRPAGMRGGEYIGSPAQSALWEFRQGAAGAKPAFAYFLLSEFNNKSRRLMLDAIRLSDSPELLTHYASDPNEYIRAEVAQASKLPRSLMPKFIQDPSSRVRAIFASREDLPTDILQAIVDSGDDDALQELARRTDLPLEIIEQLATGSSQVKRLLVYNTRTPAHVLSQLSKSPEKEIARALVMHPKLPTEALVTLANHSDELTREAVAKNPKTPVDTVVKLSKDPDPDTRRAAEQNPNFPEDLTGWALGGDDDSWL